MAVEEKRIPGLDTMRAIAASWVFIFHMGAFYDRNMIHNGFAMLFCGPAAVIFSLLFLGFASTIHTVTAVPALLFLVFGFDVTLALVSPLSRVCFLRRHFTCPQRS